MIIRFYFFYFFPVLLSTKQAALTIMRTVWRFARLLQEKTRKILDIWNKNTTFPSSVLTRLAEVAKDSQQKGAYRDPAFVLLSTSLAMQSHRPLSYRVLQ